MSLLDKLTRVDMTPINNNQMSEQMEINKIYTGDCLEVLKGVESGSVDLVLTSPPYNLGNNHHTGNKRHNSYDDNMPEQEYQNTQIAVLKELFRVLKGNGSLLYNHKNRIKGGLQITPYEWLLKTSFIIKQELVWFNRSQNFDKIRFYPMTERVYWLAKSKDTKLSNVINHHDLFNWSAVGTGKEHKRAFPLNMATDLISCFPAQLVLDPYMGSGTTAVACKMLGKNYIGIELNPEYVKIAEERLRNTTPPLLKEQSNE
jgi:modification methylase